MAKEKTSTTKNHEQEKNKEKVSEKKISHQKKDSKSKKWDFKHLTEEQKRLSIYGIIGILIIIVIIIAIFSFNSETGKYDLTGYKYVDPTSLDYSEDYYYCSSSFSTNANNNDLISVSRSISNCTTIYRLTGVSEITEGTTTGNGGTEIKTRIYRLSGYAYNQSERESDKSDKGLYTMQDDYGTSYYYRGSVTNNYVLFGGYYWRIIRLNGDGSIRLDRKSTRLNSSHL